MLFDPKWQKPETKVNPYAIETLIAWLEKQPARKHYCWIEARTCLLGQYFRDMGMADYVVQSAQLGNQRFAFGRIAGVGQRWPWDTYGNALKRARAELDAG